MWPPTGIALAALLLRGPRLWPGVFLGALLVNLTTPVSPGIALGIAFGNTLEAVFGAWLVRRYANGTNALESVGTVFKFVLWGAMVSTACSALVGVISLCLGHAARWNQFLAIFSTWWLGDIVSNLVVAPLLIVWLRWGLGRLRVLRVLEAAGLLALVALVGAVVFLSSAPADNKNQPLAYLAILPLLWAAFRFGVRGAVGSAFIMGGISLWGTLHGLGPFVRPDQNQSLLFLQAFVGTITMTGLVLAVIIAERQRDQRRLQVQDAVSRVLADAPNLKEATPKIFQALHEIGGWDLGAIWDVDRTTNELTCVELWHTVSITASAFEAITRQRRFAPGIGLPGRVWSSGKSSWLMDVTKDTNFPRAPQAAEAGLHAGFCVPLKVGEEVFGAIECFSREVREPDEHLLQILEPIGSQLGQFIERTRAEEASKRSEALRGAILESALDSIISMDRDGKIIEFNPTAEKTFGYKRSEALGKPLADLIIPLRFRDQHRRGLARYFAAGPGTLLGKRIEMIGLRADGTEMPVELSINALEFGGEQIFTSNLRDITEQKKAQAELAEAQKKLRQHAEDLEKRVAERTAKLQETIHSLDGFCYSIAHDLRAPLRAMGGFSNELFNDYGAVLDETGRDYVLRIKSAAIRMDRLILDLLRFGKLDTTELPAENVKLDDIIRKALVPLDHEVSAKGAEVRLRAPLLSVRANAVMVEQVMGNLLGNAIKFVESSTIPRVEVWTEERQGLVRVCVQDNGIGIKPEYIDKLFQPFVRLVNGAAYPGTGIGLAIVRKGTERMGGRAGVESAPGKGSCFWVELPGVKGVS